MPHCTVKKLRRFLEPRSFNYSKQTTIIRLGSKVNSSLLYRIETPKKEYSDIFVGRRLVIVKE
jgi:hypothetical protein